MSLEAGMMKTANWIRGEMEKMLNGTDKTARTELLSSFKTSKVVYLNRPTIIFAILLPITSCGLEGPEKNLETFEPLQNPLHALLGVTSVNLDSSTFSFSTGNIVGDIFPGRHSQNDLEHHHYSKLPGSAPFPHCPKITELEAKYAHRPDIRIRINESNLGASASRNRGMKESAADWILFLDDDVTPQDDILIEAEKAIRVNPQAASFIAISWLPALSSPMPFILLT
ncbi:hypothetical protein EV424DRAFT_1539626 [Suillus variegatus]|nr:hypothetical protein EV424DRAFT_1539626 [Suillus variegatus]